MIKKFYFFVFIHMGFTHTIEATYIKVICHNPQKNVLTFKLTPREKEKLTAMKKVKNLLSGTKDILKSALQYAPALGLVHALYTNKPMDENQMLLLTMLASATKGNSSKKTGATSSVLKDEQWETIRMVCGVNTHGSYNIASMKMIDKAHSPHGPSYASLTTQSRGQSCQVNGSCKSFSSQSSSRSGFKKSGASIIGSVQSQKKYGQGRVRSYPHAVLHKNQSLHSIVPNKKMKTVVNQPFSVLGDNSFREKDSAVRKK